MPAKCHSKNRPSQDVPNDSHICTSQTILQSGFQSQKNFLNCLKKLHATKGSKNALKKVDYNGVQHLKADYLLPVFNGDVGFEIPSI